MSDIVSSKPPVSEECLSDFALDALVSGRAQTAQLASHLAECQRCAERRALFVSAQEEARGSVEELVRRAQATRAHTRVDPTPERRWQMWPRIAVAGTLVAAAAVVAFMILSSGPKAPPVAQNDFVAPGSDEIRIKGTGLGFFLHRDGAVTRGRSGDRFRAGDALRFTVTTGQERYFFLFGVEASGGVSAYHPFDGERSVLLRPGVEIPLPDSLILDDSTATEYFVGIFSPKPIEFSQVRQAVSDAMQRYKEASVAVGRIDLPGTLRSVVVRRER